MPATSLESSGTDMRLVYGRPKESCLAPAASETRKALFLVCALMLLYSLNFMDRSVLGIAGDAVKADLGLSDGQLGLIHSVLLMALVFLVIPGAALGDIIGRKPLLAGSAAIWTGAMGLVGLATGFGQLLTGRVMASVNEAAVGAGAPAWLSNYFPAEKRGRILGIFQMSEPLGMALGVFLGGFALTLMGNWRMAYYALLFPGLLCLFLIPKLPDRQIISANHYFQSFARLFKIRTIILCGIAAGFYCIAKFAYQAWFPALLLRSYPELSPGQAGFMAGSFLLAGIAGPFAGGMFSDWCARKNRAGRAYAAAICLCAITASKFALYWLTGKIGLWPLCVVGLIDGILTMTPIPVYMAMSQDVAPENLRGTACGIMGAVIYLCGGAWGPILIGMLSDWFNGGANGLRMAQLCLLAFPALSALCFLWAARPYSRENLAGKF